MSGFKKNKPTTRTEIMKIALSHFASTSRWRTTTISIIVLITFFKNYLYYEAENAKLNLKKSKTVNQMKAAFIKTAMYNSQWFASNFITDHLFESHLTTYGGSISLMVLDKIFGSDLRGHHTYLMAGLH